MTLVEGLEKARELVESGTYDRYLDAVYGVFTTGDTTGPDKALILELVAMLEKHNLVDRAIEEAKRRERE